MSDYEYCSDEEMTDERLLEMESYMATVSPRSFLFFIIADLASGGSHGTTPYYRPLAITYRQGRAHGPGPTFESNRQRVRQIVLDCAHAVSTLAQRGNRPAVEAEVSLARAEWLRAPDRVSQTRVQVPDRPQPGLSDLWLEDRPETSDARPASPSPPSKDIPIREYPFISTCLRLALTRAGEGTGAKLEDVREQPLNTIYRQDALEYGAAVIDISDLDDVRYGIVGSKIRYYAHPRSQYCGSWNPSWDSIEHTYRGPPPELHLDTSGARSPLSAAAYLDKFWRSMSLEGIDVLAGCGGVDAQALEYIWPPIQDPLDGDDLSAMKVSSADAMKTTSTQGPDSIGSLISLASLGTLDLEANGDITSLPNFQNRLQEHLLRHPAELPSSDASTQLLGLAYAGQNHLNWTAYRTTSFEHVAKALDSTRLRNARAFSICIDAMDDGPETLFAVLARHDSIRHICLLEGPSRANDDKSGRLFAHLCSSPFGATLLRHRFIVVTCAYSAPLRRCAWLRQAESPESAAFRHAFPVTHLFVRQQYIAKEHVERVENEAPWIGEAFWDEEDPERDEGRSRRYDKNDEPVADADMTFRPCRFFLGDAMLVPQRFVLGFLQYCQSVLDDEPMMRFAAAPAGGEYPVGPSPVDAFACEYAADQAGRDPRSSAGSLASTAPAPAGHVEAGSWIALVSHEWRTTKRQRKWRRGFRAFGYAADWSIGLPVVRYALLRARRRIDVAEAPSDVPCEQLAGTEYIDTVCGIEGFMELAAPDADQSMIHAHVEETQELLRARWSVGRGRHAMFPADMEMLETLGDGEARDVFRDFLAEAGSGGAPTADAVFRDLTEEDLAGDAKPLGTRRLLNVDVSVFAPAPWLDEEVDRSSTWIEGPPKVVK